MKLSPGRRNMTEACQQQLQKTLCLAAFADADAGRSKININDELNTLAVPYPVLVSRSSRLLLVA